jgi:hypothetical protein
MMSIDEAEELMLQAHELSVSLFYRRNEGERLERLYQKAQARYTRRAEYLADYEQMRMESSIEARAYDD